MYSSRQIVLLTCVYRILQQNYTKFYQLFFVSIKLCAIHTCIVIFITYNTIAYILFFIIQIISSKSRDLAYHMAKWALIFGIFLKLFMRFSSYFSFIDYISSTLHTHTRLSNFEMRALNPIGSYIQICLPTFSCHTMKTRQ